MVTESVIVGIINVLVGLFILLIEGSLRFIVGGYLLLTGLIMVIIPLLG
jgi:hypothetical protein